MACVVGDACRREGVIERAQKHFEERTKNLELRASRLDKRTLEHLEGLTGGAIEHLEDEEEEQEEEGGGLDVEDEVLAHRRRAEESLASRIESLQVPRCSSRSLPVRRKRHWTDIHPCLSLGVWTDAAVSSSPYTLVQSLSLSPCMDMSVSTRIQEALWLSTEGRCVESSRAFLFLAP